MGLLGMALVAAPLSAQTVDVHTHIIIPEYVEVLKANLQKLKQMLASDEELAGYTDLFLWKNAERLFVNYRTTDGTK